MKEEILQAIQKYKSRLKLLADDFNKSKGVKENQESLLKRTYGHATVDAAEKQITDLKELKRVQETILESKLKSFKKKYGGVNGFTED